MSSSMQSHSAFGHDPKDEACWQKLVTLYGYERANRIVKGEDLATNQDIRAWRELGAPKPRVRVEAL